jgi:hypothetical protein
MVSVGSSAAELERCRQALIARASYERHAMRETTEELQDATDRFAHIAIVGVRLVRRYWLPVGVVLAGTLFKRVRPMLRAARTGLAVWQTIRLVRNARR